jgi:hypothetical protein
MFESNTCLAILLEGPRKTTAAWERIGSSIRTRFKSGRPTFWKID